MAKTSRPRKSRTAKPAKTAKPPPPLSVADRIERQQEVAALQKARDGRKLTKADTNAIRRYERRREDEQRDAALARVPQRVLCEITDTDRRQIGRWEADGMPFVVDGRQKYYDLRLVLRWLKKRWMTGDTGTGELSKRSAEIKLLVRREAALQLKMQIMSGQLRDRNEVEAENAQKVTAVRAGLEALRRSLGPAALDLAENATIEDAEALVWDYVEPLLNAFSDAK